MRGALGAGGGAVLYHVPGSRQLYAVCAPTVITILRLMPHVFYCKTDWLGAGLVPALQPRVVGAAGSGSGSGGVAAAARAQRLARAGVPLGESVSGFG